MTEKCIPLLVLWCAGLYGCGGTAVIQQQDVTADEVESLIAEINVNPSPFHYEYTPAVNKLVDIGGPAVRPTLGLMMSDDWSTRLRAQCVIEGVIYRMYGFVYGQGWPERNRDDEVRRFWDSLGNLDWESPADRRSEALSRWHEWLAGGGDRKLAAVPRIVRSTEGEPQHGDAESEAADYIAQLRAEDWRDRRMAAMKLECLGDRAVARRSVPALVDALGDESAAVRLAVAEAVVSIDRAAASESAIPVIVGILRAGSDDQRWRAAMTLGRIGPEDESVIPALRAALQDDWSTVRIQAAESLGAFGALAEAAVPDLIEMLRSENWAPYQIYAIAALGRIGPGAAEAAPYLEAAAKDADAEVSSEAKRALAAIRKE